jgi:hypothetical protein
VTTVPNWIAVLGLIVAPVTGLVGYVLAGRNERARDERATRREAMARRATVRERLEQERHAFQRETLLDLQDALQRQVRSVAKMILHDKRSLQERGALTFLGSELDAESYEIGVTVRRLQERVMDETVRRAVEEFRSHVTHVETSFATVHEMSAEDGVRHLDSLQHDLVQHYIALSDQMGKALRGELGWLPEETQPE